MPHPPLRRSVLACTTLIILLTAGALPPLRGAEPTFERDILPLLTGNCLGCHGGLRKKGDLDLRTIPAMQAGGESGPAIAASDLENSLLWQKVVADEMPPGDKKLSADDKTLLKSWIAAGLPTLAASQADIDPLLAPGNLHDPAEVAAAIDRHVERHLAAAKLTPAPRSDDAEFLRRVSLDLTGRVPTPETAAAFLDDPSPDKRARFIDTLLDSPAYGEQLGRVWRDWMAPPELPSDPNGGRQPHDETREVGKWLGKRFAAGDRWDAIVRDILTSQGEVKQRPEIIFFGLAGEGGKPSASGAARAVGSLFMGVQLQCAQCHDDPYRTWAQDQHWALAAFFDTMGGDFGRIFEGADPQRKKDEKPPPPRDPERLGKIEIPKSAFLNAGKIVQAAYLDGQQHNAAAEAPLRAPLADWLTAKDNPYFARAFANRMWFYLLGRGIVHPVDDFRELNPPSHPGLMKLLASEFADSGFDVKHLLRCICNSAAYQRTSRLPAGADDQTTGALTAAFGRMPLRVMTADMLYDSLKLAYSDEKLDLRAIDPKDGNTDGESAPVADRYLEFLRRFGTNEDDAADFTHGIPQMLAMINHPRLLGQAQPIDEFCKNHPDARPAAVVERLYLSTLSRRPTADEAREACEYVESQGLNSAAYVGVLWMLVNRSEFLFVR